MVDTLSLFLEVMKFLLRFYVRSKEGDEEYFHEDVRAMKLILFESYLFIRYSKGLTSDTESILSDNKYCLK